MFSLVLQALLERFKALFTSHAALDVEAQFVARDSERKAELLRRAKRYDAEGLHGIANHLRLRASRLSAEQPLASTLLTAEHLLAQKQSSAVPVLPFKPKKKGR